MDAQTAFVVTNLVAAPLLPPLNLILLGLGGLLLLKRRPRLGKTLIATSLALLYCLATPLVANHLLGLLEPPPLEKKQASSAQAIVVLGSGVYEDAPEYGRHAVSSFALERLEYAAALHRQTGLPILVSGGKLSNLPAEAPIMKRVLEEEFHVPVRWVEARSTNSAENARYSAAILRPEHIRRVLVVTHAWHVPRARQAFRAADLEFIAAPTRFAVIPGKPMALNIFDFLPDGRALAKSYFALHEYVGAVWYRLRFLIQG
jgi:uncharacterized SAM-binding protein YcdF (DUF218 family)